MIFNINTSPSGGKTEKNRVWALRLGLNEWAILAQTGRGRNVVVAEDGR